MNIQTEAQPAKAKEPEYKAQTRVVAAFFVASVYFGGEHLGVNIGRNVDSIVPARMGLDGMAVPLDAQNQRADGLLLRRKSHDLNTHQRSMLAAFVPFANVRCIQYGE